MVTRTQTSAKRGRPSLAEKPKGETREQLLAAAAAVFAEEGYSASSVSTIAERVGITSGAVYRHFSNKAHILLELLKKDLHVLPIAEKLATKGRPSISFFAKLISMYVDPSLYMVRRLAVEIHAAAARDPEAAAVLKTFTDHARDNLCARLEAAKADGLVPQSIDVRQSVNILLILVMGLANIDTLDPALVGNRKLMRFLERSVEIMLTTEQAE